MQGTSMQNGQSQLGYIIQSGNNGNNAQIHNQPMIVNNPSQTLYSVISNGGLITLQPNNVISLLSHQHVMPQQSNSNTTNPVMIVGMDNLIKNISTNGVVKQQNVNTIIHSDETKCSQQPQINSIKNISNIVNSTAKSEGSNDTINESKIETNIGNSNIFILADKISKEYAIKLVKIKDNLGDTNIDLNQFNIDINTEIVKDIKYISVLSDKYAEIIDVLLEHISDLNKQILNLSMNVDSNNNSIIKKPFQIDTKNISIKQHIKQECLNISKNYIKKIAPPVKCNKEDTKTDEEINYKISPQNKELKKGKYIEPKREIISPKLEAKQQAKPDNNTLKNIEKNGKNGSNNKRKRIDVNRDRDRDKDLPVPKKRKKRRTIYSSSDSDDDVSSDIDINSNIPKDCKMDQISTKFDDDSDNEVISGCVTIKSNKILKKNTKFNDHEHIKLNNNVNNNNNNKNIHNNNNNNNNGNIIMRNNRILSKRMNKDDIKIPKKKPLKTKIPKKKPSKPSAKSLPTKGTKNIKLKKQYSNNIIKNNNHNNNNNGNHTTKHTNINSINNNNNTGKCIISNNTNKSNNNNNNNNNGNHNTKRHRIIKSKKDVDYSV